MCYYKLLCARGKHDEGALQYTITQYARDIPKERLYKAYD